MNILSPKSFVVFDLDDTLYKEVDFLLSAYRSIAHILYPEVGYDLYDEMHDLYDQRLSVLDVIKQKYDFSFTISQLVSIYRYHFPYLRLPAETGAVLGTIQNRDVAMGLLTDGRSISQRNKLAALQIEGYFSSVVISEEIGSEKPSVKNYSIFEEAFPDTDLVYVGDNTCKDFITPNKLGWTTICLRDDGRNIHKQDFDLDEEYLPQIIIDSLDDLLSL